MPALATPNKRTRWPTIAATQRLFSHNQRQLKRKSFGSRRAQQSTAHNKANLEEAWVHVPMIETGRILEETCWGNPWWWEVLVGKAVAPFLNNVTWCPTGSPEHAIPTQYPHNTHCNTHSIPAQYPLVISQFSVPPTGNQNSLSS